MNPLPMDETMQTQPIASTSAALELAPPPVTMPEVLPSPLMPGVPTADLPLRGTVPSTFAAALYLASLGPTPVQAVTPPPYVIPSSAVNGHAATGLVGGARISVITDDEDAKATADIKGGRVTPGPVLGDVKFVREEDVKNMTVSELKKRGLGRGPTGEFNRSRDARTHG
jgi:hypothetical protein